MESQVEAPDISEEVLDCFQEGVIGTLRNVWVEPPSCSRRGQAGLPREGITGLMDLRGKPALHFALGFSREAATHVALRYFDFEIEYDSSDMDDAVGEITNAVAGDISARLEQVGVDAELSQPTVRRDLAEVDGDENEPVCRTINAPRLEIFLKVAPGPDGDDQLVAVAASDADGEGKQSRGGLLNWIRSLWQ